MVGACHRCFVLLLLLLFGMTARGQVDMCITFESVSATYPYRLPDEWTTIRGSDFGGYASQQDAYVNSNSHSSPNALYFSSNADFYVVMPYMNVEFEDGLYMQFWAYHGWNIEVGSMTDPTDESTFHRITDPSTGTGNSWERYVVDLSSAPSGDHYIAFHKIQQGDNAYIDDMRIMTNGCMVWNFRCVNYESHYDANMCTLIHQSCDTVLPPVQFTWDAIGNPAVSVLLYVSDGGTTQYLLNHIYYGLDTVTLHLSGDTTYNMMVTVNCTGETGPCSTSSTGESYSINIIQPECDSSSCINTRKLFSTKVTPFYGTYEDPYTHVGNYTLNDDPTSPQSRHMICTDTTLTDPVVGYQLNIVPPGDDHSVRLGNWNVGSQAEAMLYTISVDTTDFDMLILKYAAVMEDPDHTPDNQPRFRIEVLDADGGLIEPAGCNSYDFVASQSLGWNTTYWSYSHIVLWKDWTVVGIDVSAYHGRTVKLRLTTYDCDMGAHFGYAYYNLHCAKKTLSFSSCSEGDSNRVEAPEGFNYSWRRDDSDSVISTSRIATIPVDGHQYYCDLSFIGDPSCSVTLSALSRLVWPEADFDYTVSRDNCRFHLQFHDRSHHVGDTTAVCDNLLWIFDDYGTSTLRNPDLWLSDSGTYAIKLVASIAGGECHDTIVRFIRLAYASDTVDTAICSNQTLLFNDSVYTETGRYSIWPNCDSLVILDLLLNDTLVIDTAAVACDHLIYRDSTFYTDTLFDFVYTDVAGCDSIYRLHLVVHPEYELSDTIVVCPDQPYRYMESGHTPPCDFDTMLHTVYGCDSLVHVTIVDHVGSMTPLAVYSLDGVHWADSVPIKACTPAILHLRDTTPGCLWNRWTLQVPDTTVTVTAPELVHGMASPVLPGLATLEIQYADLCFDTLRWPIYVFPSPEAAFSWVPDPPADVHPEVQLLNYSQPDDCWWLWTVETVDGGTDSLTAYSPAYRWEGTLPTGDFDVTLCAGHLMHFDTISHTCVDTVTHPITIVTAWLEFPNLVTPNGDGVNDIWGVVNLVELGQYPINELWIYDAWGVLVFHAKDIYRYEDFWDPEATDSPDGTYFYRFTAKSAYGIVKRNGLIEVVH